MERIYGHKDTLPIECINPQLDKWRVRWDVQPEKEGVSYQEAELQHKPTIEEVRDMIEEWINAKTSDRILRGYTWEGTPVWLSPENQLNILSLRAVAKSGDKFESVVFKFGHDEPVYTTITTYADLSRLCAGVAKHVADTLKAGWSEKEAIDYGPYEKLL